MSRGTSKSRNKAEHRRKIRRAEKKNFRDDAPMYDKSIGRACHRRWGAGKDLK